MRRDLEDRSAWFPSLICIFEQWLFPVRANKKKRLIRWCSMDDTRVKHPPICWQCMYIWKVYWESQHTPWIQFPIKKNNGGILLFALRILHRYHSRDVQVEPVCRISTHDEFESLLNYNSHRATVVKDDANVSKRNLQIGSSWLVWRECWSFLVEKLIWIRQVLSRTFWK